MKREWLMAATLLAAPVLAQTAPAKKPAAARRTILSLSSVQDQPPFTAEQLEARRKEAGDDSESIAADQELNGWKLCVLDSVTRWAPLKEGPGTIADAAFGRCADNEHRYRDYLTRLTQDGRATVDLQMAKALMKSLEDAWRPRIAAAVLDQRLAALQPQAAPETPIPDVPVKP